MAEKVGEVYLEIGAVMGAFETALANARKKTQDLEKQFESTSAKISQMAQKMSDVGKKMSTFLTVPLVGMGTAMVKFSSDTEESLNKVRVAFGESSKSVEDWSKTSLTAMGLSRQSALDQASLYGDMATSMGLATDEAADMSMTLVQLGADLASFKNVSADVAATALKGVFTGEGESLKSLGVVMQDSTLEAYALAKGLKTKYTEMSQAEKVTLRYQYVLANTKNAQGDFQRTSEGAANQMRIFTESLKEVAANLGAVILPAFTAIIKNVNSVIMAFSAMDESTKTIIITIGALAAAIGPVLLIVGNLIKAYQAAVLVGTAFKAGMALQAAATGASTMALAANRIAIIAATVAQKAFNLAAKANPWVLLATAIIAGTAAIYGLVKSLMAGASAAGRAAEEKRKLADNMERLKAITSETSQAYDGYIAQMKEDDVSRKQIIATLQTQVKLLQVVKTAQLDYSSKQATQAQIDAINQKIDALKKEEKQQQKTNSAAASDKWLAARKAATKKWSAYNDTFMKSELELAEYNYKKDQAELDDAYNQKMITTDMYYQASKNKQQEYENAKTKIQEEAEKRRLEMAAGALSTASNYTNQVASLVSQYYQNQITSAENAGQKQLDALDEWYETQKESLKDQYGDTKEYKKQLEKLDEQKAEKEEAIEKATQKKTLELKIEAAKKEKVFNIASTIMNTAVAVMKALATLGPIAGPVMAGFVTALGAAQVALIASTPLPTAAEGIYAESPYIGGEAGPELAFPLSSERGKKAISLLADGVINSIASRQNQGNQATVSTPETSKTQQSGNVFLDGTLVGKWISSGSQNGLFTIDSRVVVA